MESKQWRQALLDHRVSILVSVVLIAMGMIGIVARGQLLGGILLIALGCSDWAYRGWRWNRRRRQEPQSDEQYARGVRLDAYLFGVGVMAICVGVLAYDGWRRQPSILDIPALIGIPLAAYLLYRVATFRGTPHRSD
jgi:MFS family permease